MAEDTRPQGNETNGDGAARQTSSSPRDKDSIPAPGEPRMRPKRRRKVSFLTINKVATVDYKDVATLRRFINDRGKILPARQTGNTAKQQRMIARAIRRAREMALLPFVVTEPGPDRREFAPRDRGGYRGDRDRDRGDRDRDRAPRSEAPRVEAAPKADAPAAEAAPKAAEPEAAAETVEA